MNRYEVLFSQDGSLKESFADDELEKAKNCARAMGNWNHPCQVVDVETDEVVFESKAYVK